MYKPKKIILTAGPSITQKEVRYVVDAVKNGWNRNWAGYIHKFEKKFSEYIGVRYAIATCGGAGALHLALASLEIGPGDEVILPEITYWACSDVVRYLGAKPVFADILKDTWCIDPISIKKNITKKTRAIMPVYTYGNLIEVDEILEISRKYKIPIVEDACPAVGSLYKGKKPGSFGEFGAFSFQGAKIMVTGFGGMLVTDSEKLYKRALFLNSRGENPNKQFWQLEVGYTHEMSNIQAALGLAQLERIEELVSKKRKIFSWYYERLKDIDGISLNYERPNTVSNMWMTSIVLNKNFGISRDEFRDKLKKKKIDNRPFFYPISMFPLYKSKRKENPGAYHVGLQGINLPSGVMLTEKEVDYVASQVANLLLK